MKVNVYREREKVMRTTSEWHILKSSSLSLLSSHSQINTYVLVLGFVSKLDILLLKFYRKWEKSMKSIRYEESKELSLSMVRGWARMCCERRTAIFWIFFKNTKASQSEPRNCKCSLFEFREALSSSPITQPHIPFFSINSSPHGFNNQIQDIRYCR